MRTAIAIFVLLIILAGLGFVASYGEKSLSFFNAQKSEDKNEGISVLILGRVAEGQGGRWHVAPKLTDAIIVAEYVPQRGIVNLVSLPRDLYGEFGGSEFKINEVYSRQKIGDLLNKLPDITGLEVENYIVLDVGVIEAAIDNLGGIDVTLEDPVTDPVSGYKLEPGMHHISGEDAVWIMRNRYAPGGDFFREKNQHLIIESIFRTFSVLPPVEKTKFLLNMVPYAETAESNFSFSEVVTKIGAIDQILFNSITLDFSTGLLRSSYIPVGGPVVTGSQPTTTPTSTTSTAPSTATSTSATSLQAYILIPSEGINNYSSIRAFIIERLK